MMIESSDIDSLIEIERAALEDIRATLDAIAALIHTDESFQNESND